ncbi:hypothetical protein MLD38_023265 [Melastoma candidum]|uniref:Uncharacterized protein n=1 Tax=Melastoma candidum TaxID=119954 RepID=A0ACB9QQF5_9MYRT|nr:hypothetical protein MLD38_023265 [Melastoma candidum]
MKLFLLLERETGRKLGAFDRQIPKIEVWMDLETENRIAAILMKEAAELRRQAAEEGALAYLRKPTVRTRPNSRFLTATVLGVQQSNKAVEMSEMWRVRQKERGLDNRLKRSVDENDGLGKHEDIGHPGDGGGGHDSNCDDAGHPNSSRGAAHKNHRGRDDPGGEGFGDEEMEEFLNSRIKRGRGTVGSRMDETGPYLPSSSLEDAENHSSCPEVRQRRVVYGPEKPPDKTRRGASSKHSQKDEKKDKTSLRRNYTSDGKFSSKKPKDKRGKRRKD